MQKRIVIFTLSLIALFTLAFTALAKSGVLELSGGDNYEITCNGSKLVLQQQNATKGTANCEADPAPSGPSVTQFILVNADSNQDIGPLADNTTLNLASLPLNLNIRAETNPAQVGSVKYQVNGADHSIENIPPYAFAGDSNGNYNPWTPNVGQYTLTAIPYPEKGADGTAGSPLTVTFNVVDDNGQPTPTNTPEPTPTNTPEATPTDPVSSVPPCPDHNPNEWHALYDPVRNCHYNHEHKDDPTLVDDLFGPVGALYGGQSISYPWQTPNENQIKHEGYGWLVRKNMSCYAAHADYCITDFRGQFHAIMSGVGAATRFHSFWLEARGCSEADPDNCGIIRTGGWSDYGHLEINDQHTPLASDPEVLADGRRRLHGDRNFGTWYGSNEMAGIALLTSRMWGNINPSDPGQLHLHCPDAKCKNNNSTMEAHVIQIWIPKSLDADQDGIVNFKGYTDLNGKIDSNCSSVGPQCVPLEIIDMPVGYYQYRDDNHDVALKDYDTSPPGEYWIEYPN